MLVEITESPLGLWPVVRSWRCPPLWHPTHNSGDKAQQFVVKCLGIIQVEALLLCNTFFSAIITCMTFNPRFSFWGQRSHGIEGEQG